MEMKTHVKVSFEKTLLVQWIKSLSSTAQDNEDGKGSKIQNIGKRFQGKISQQVTKYTDIFSRQNSVDILFLVYGRNIIAFDSSTKRKFHFSTGYDLKTATPSRQFPVKYLTIPLTRQVDSKWTVCVFVVGIIFDGVGNYIGSWY